MGIIFIDGTEVEELQDLWFYLWLNAMFLSKETTMLTHLHKRPELCQLLKDVERHGVQAGLPPRGVLSRHSKRMWFLDGDDRI